MTEERLSKTDAMAKADAGWEAWRGFLVGEGQAGRAELKGSEGWTLAEAVAHVARWQLWAVARMQGVLRGERLERLDVDGQNATWAEQDRGLAFPVAMKQLDSAWTELRRAATAIPDEKWKRLIGAVFAANTWEHYEEHLAWRPSGQ